MRLLDLFCGAGGAAMGYSRAGFTEIVGVDIKPQPRYPFRFIQADALAPPVRLEDFDAIHASPPCQKHVKGLRAVNDGLKRPHRHQNLIPETRRVLTASARPYVIENVVGAELQSAIELCGSSFGLPIRRHRRFESNVFLLARPCDHSWQTEQKYWNGDRSVRNADGTRSYSGHGRRSSVVQIYGHAGEREQWPAALGIDWMTDDEMIEAIPPAFAEFIGRQLIAALERAA